MNHRVLINLTVFLAAFATMIVWAVNNIVSVEAIERPYEISGEFEQAAGLLPRAEVAYLGVHYGTVGKVERLPGKIRVTMKIDRDKKIPAGSTAHIFRKSAIGEPFIDFFPPEDYQGDKGPYLREGEVVPKKRTTTPLEFSELLRAASRVVSGISPESTNTLIHELALAMHGRGDQFRELTLAGDKLAGTFAARTEVLDRLATNSTRLTRVFAEHSDAFGQSLGDLRQVAESLRQARGDTRVLLERGSEFLGATADLVADSKGTIDCVLKDLVTVIDTTTTPERLAGLQTLLQVGPTAFNNVWDTRDVEPDGVWVRVGFVNNPNNPPLQYVPPREAPATGQIQPCASPLQPTGQDFTPTPQERAAANRAAADGGSEAARSTSLPTPSGPGLLFVGLAGLAAAVVVRSTGRFQA